MTLSKKINKKHLFEGQQEQCYFFGQFKNYMCVGKTFKNGSNFHNNKGKKKNKWVNQDDSVNYMWGQESCSYVSVSVVGSDQLSEENVP